MVSVSNIVIAGQQRHVQGFVYKVYYSVCVCECVHIGNRLFQLFEIV